jgi:hypothetical protein
MASQTDNKVWTYKKEERYKCQKEENVRKWSWNDTIQDIESIWK